MRERHESAYGVIIQQSFRGLAASCRTHVGVGAIDAAIGDMANRLRHAGLSLDQPPTLVWHKRGTVDCDLEILIPVNDVAVNVPDIKFTTVSPTNCAMTTYHGPYAGISDAYQRLSGWIQRSQLEIAGPHQETYVRFGPSDGEFVWPNRCLEEDPTKFVTEVGVPVHGLDLHT